MRRWWALKLATAGREKRGDSLDKGPAHFATQGVDTGDRLQWQVLARQTGAAGKLQVGEYALSPETTPSALLQAMRDGKVVRRMFTIVEELEHPRPARGVGEGRRARTRFGDSGRCRVDEGAGRPRTASGRTRFLPETYARVKGDSDLDVLKRAHGAMQAALDGPGHRAPMACR